MEKAETTTGALASNAGDQFHFVYVARKMLTMLNPRNRLNLITVEGVSRQDATASENVSDFLAVDVAEYYGGCSLTEADRVVVSQLKYSHANPDKHWTLSRLTDTRKVLRKLADTFRCFHAKYPEDIRKLTLVLYTNQPLQNDLRNKFEEIRKNLTDQRESGRVLQLSTIPEEARDAAKILCDATEFNLNELQLFFSLWNFDGFGQLQLDDAKRKLQQESRIYKQSSTCVSFNALMRAAQEAATAGYEHQIDPEFVYQRLNLTPQSFYPAPYQFSKDFPTINSNFIKDAIAKIANCNEAGFTLVHGPNGCGKSTLLWMLAKESEYSSYVVPYDCWDQGRGPDSTQKRFLLEKFLTQIVNEIELQFETEIFACIEDTPTQRNNVFVAAVQKASAIAATKGRKLLIVIDAVDSTLKGSGRIASKPDSLAYFLKDWNPPENCHVIVSARTQNIDNLPFLEKIGLRLEISRVTKQDGREFVQEHFDLPEDAVEYIIENANGDPRIYQAIRLALSPSDKDNWRIAIDRVVKSGVAQHEKEHKLLSAITKKLARESHDYIVESIRFMENYLGTIDRPAPFGGRGQELNALDRWLEDTDAKPYRLMTAPAGRGKSAIIAHWYAELIWTREELEVVIIPISLRFKTSAKERVISMLVRSLARVLGETDRSEPPSERLAKDYISKVSNSNRSVLLIIDGIDELELWSLGELMFPVKPANSAFRVLVTARTAPNDPNNTFWLRQLGWCDENAERDTLHSLGIEKIPDVLHRMGAPLGDLPDEGRIVRSLYNVSQGDPLLLGLYVQALWDTRHRLPGITLDGLQTIKPGLESFFEMWMDGQKQLWKERCKAGEMDRNEEITTYKLLRIFACARGPISRADIQQLLPEYEWNGFTIREALECLQRFIVGNADHGYSFGHPEFGRHIAESRTFMDSDERISIEENFFAMGRSMLLSASEPNSEYAIRYSAIHLEYLSMLASDAEERGRFADDAIFLTSNHWMECWLSTEGGYTGFLHDIETAQRILRRLNSDNVENISAKRLLQELRCSLVHSSVKEFANNVSPFLLHEAIQRGAITPVHARSLALAMVPRKRLPVLVKILRQLGGQDAPQTRALIVDDYLALDRNEQITFLEHNAWLLPDEVVKEAIVLVRDIGNGWYKGNLVEQLVRTADESVIPSLMILASQIPFSEVKSSILRVIGNKIDTTHFDQFVNIVDGLYDRKQRFRALELSYPKLEHSQQSLAFNSTMRSKFEDSDAVTLTSFLERIVPYLTDDYVSEIFGNINSLQSSVARVKILALLSPFLINNDATAVAVLAHQTLHRTFGDSIKIWSNTWKKLPPRLRELIIASLLMLSDNRFEDAVRSLAPSLEIVEIKRFIQRALTIEKKLNRVSVAIRLMSFLRDPSRYEEGARFLAEGWKEYKSWPLTGITLDEAIQTIELSEDQISNLSRWVRTANTGSLRRSMGRIVTERTPPKIEIAEELEKMRTSKALDGNWLFHLRRISSDFDLSKLSDEIIEFIEKSPSTKSTGDYTYPSMLCEALALIGPVLDEVGKDRLLSMIQNEPSLFGSEEVYRQLTKLSLSERQINRLNALAMQNRWTFGYGGLSELFPFLSTVTQRNVLITVTNPNFSSENEATTQEVISRWFDQTKEKEQQQLMFEKACLLSCPRSRAFVMITIARGDSAYAQKAMYHLVEACQATISELQRIKIIEYATSMLGKLFVRNALVLYESLVESRARAKCLKVIARFAEGDSVVEIVNLAKFFSDPELIAEILLEIPCADSQPEKDLARHTLDAIEQIRFPHIQLQTAIKYLERGRYDRDRAFSIAMYSLKDASTIQWRHELVMSLCALIDAPQVGLVLDYFRSVTSKRLSSSLAMGLLQRINFGEFDSIIRRVRELEDDPHSLSKVIWHTLSSPHSRDTFLNDLIEVVQRIPSEFERRKLLTETSIINKLMVLPLFIAWRERFPTDLRELIESLCPILDQRDAKPMLEILLQVEDPWVRELGLELIADRFTDASVVDALKRSQMIGDVNDREFALQQVIPLISKSMLANAIAYLGEIRKDDVRAELLGNVLDQISPDDAILVDLSYSQIRRFKDENLRTSLIITKLNIIAPAMRNKILYDISELMSEDIKTQVLGSLLPFLSANEINTAFEQLETLNSAQRVEALCIAGPNLPQTGLVFINAIARNLQEESLKQRIFERYLGLMPESELDESFRIIGSLSNMRQLEIIRRWIDSFDSRSQQRLVSLISDAKSDEARAELLMFCLPRLSREIQVTALKVISTLTLVQQTATYCKVINTLADDHLELVLQHTEKLSDPFPIRDLLIQLLPRLQDRLLQRGINKLYELNHDHRYKVVLSILRKTVPLQLARYFIVLLTSDKRVWNKAEIISAALETMPVEFESKLVKQVSVLSISEQHQVAILVKKVSAPLGIVLLDAVERSVEKTKQQVLTELLPRLPLESMPRGLSILRGLPVQISSKILTFLIKELADSQEKVSLIVHELFNLHYPAEKFADVLFFANGFAFELIAGVAHILTTNDQHSFVVRILQLYEREILNRNFDFLSRSSSVSLLESINELPVLDRPELAEAFERIIQRTQQTINPRVSVLSSEETCTISSRLNEDGRVNTSRHFFDEKSPPPLNETLPPIDRLHNYLKYPERYDHHDKYQIFKLFVDELSSLPRAEFMRNATSLAKLLDDIAGDQSSALLCDAIIDVGRQLP